MNNVEGANASDELPTDAGGMAKCGFSNWDVMSSRPTPLLVAGFDVEDEYAEVLLRDAVLQLRELDATLKMQWRAKYAKDEVERELGKDFEKRGFPPRPKNTPEEILYLVAVAEDEEFGGIIEFNEPWGPRDRFLDHASEILGQSRAVVRSKYRAAVARVEKDMIKVGESLTKVKSQQKPKDERPPIYRAVDKAFFGVKREIDDLDLNTKINEITKRSDFDPGVEEHLVQIIAKTTNWGKRAARKAVQDSIKTVKAENRPKKKKSQVVGNMVGVDGHKELVDYARIKLAEANEENPSTFRYGTAIGRVQHVPEEGTTSVTILNKDGLRASINESARFYRINGKGETRGVSTPPDVVSDLYQEQLPIPYLRQVSNYPQFDEDVNLLATNGYHGSAFLYMHLPDDLEMPEVSENPTQEQLTEALRLVIEEWLADFPFDGYSRREILVSCGIEKPCPFETAKPVPPSLLSFLAFTLQPLVRPVIGKSPMPALLISKPEAGTGATLLVNTAQNIVHGATSTRTIPKDEDERRKEVFTALRGGDPFMFFDNVTGSVDSPVLAALLTSVSFTGRILGKSEEANIPNNASVVITGNNPRFTRELQRRLSLCRLDAGVAQPENREPAGGWRHCDIEDWVMNNRGQLLWALGTLVMNWKAEGCPKPSGRPVGSYRAWFEVCGGILEAAGFEGFQSNREQIENVAGSDDDDPMNELVTQWYEEATKSSGALGLTGQYIKGEHGLAAFCDAREIELPVAKHMVDGERIYKPSALGQYLGTQAERVFAVDGVNVKIESGKKGKHGKPWGLTVT